MRYRDNSKYTCFVSRLKAIQVLNVKFVVIFILNLSVLSEFIMYGLRFLYLPALIYLDFQSILTRQVNGKEEGK